MPRQFLNFIYRESRSLNQAALLLGFFALLAQILAFLRDRLLAHIFGASSELDVYYAAFRVPDFIFVTVASVVSVSVLVPFIIEKRENLKEFIDNIFSFFALLIFAVSAAAWFLMPAINGLLFRGLGPEELALSITLSRILLLSPLILGVSNLFGSITQAHQRFALYGLAPVLYNAGIIVGILTLSREVGVVGVVWGVVIGALLHAAIQLPFIIKKRLTPGFRRIDWAVIGQVAALSVPRTLTLSMSSLAFIFLVSYASLMTEGSISVLSFANNLQSVPLSLIGVSYSLAAFPILSRRFQEKNLAAFLEQMRTSARFIIFWSLPLATLFIMLRAQIVRVLLGTGEFDWNATRLTAAAVALFVVSTVAQSLTLLLMRGFYSAGKTLKPFLISVFSTGGLISLTYILVKTFYESENFRYFWGALLKVEDLPGNAVLMLSLGFSLGTTINMAILWYFFEKEFKGLTKGLAKVAFQTFGASVLMGAAAYLGLNFFVKFFDTATLPGLFLQGFCSWLLAIILGVMVLQALRSCELSEAGQALRGKFWRAKVVATDPEIV